MNETLENINKKLTPYYSLLTMIGFFLMLFISSYKFIISPSDLRISVQNEKISYPSSIGRYYEVIYDEMLKQDTLLIEAASVYSFLLKTSDFKSITLKNTSSKTLRTVRFKYLNTDALTAWSISSNFLTNFEENNLKKNLIFDEVRNIVYFKNVVDIPPNSQININLWGNFKDELINSNIITNHESGEGHIEQSYNISGLKGYFVNYAFEFLVILMFIFIVVYYVGIKYARAR